MIQVYTCNGSYYDVRVSMSDVTIAVYMNACIYRYIYYPGNNALFSRMCVNMHIIHVCISYNTVLTLINVTANLE